MLLHLDQQQAHLVALMGENAVLARELAAAQNRSTHIAQEQAHRIASLEAMLVRLRGDLIRSETDRSRLQEQLTRIEAARPGATSEPVRDTDKSADTKPLSNQTVLCVGGRTAAVPLYRYVIERTGGRFLHHDGGEHHCIGKLDTTLAAADLVICQTGCISHDAYWRVKEHCKRTGKRCAFVETPSKAALQKALSGLSQSSADRDERPITRLQRVRAGNNATSD